MNNKWIATGKQVFGVWNMLWALVQDVQVFFFALILTDACVNQAKFGWKMNTVLKVAGLDI